MESILEKKAYLCDDRVIRDIKGAFRSYKVSSNTEEAVGLIFEFLTEMKPETVVFLLDAQISKSGMLARTLREKIGTAGLKGDARTSKHVDYDLKTLWGYRCYKRWSDNRRGREGGELPVLRGGEVQAP